MCFWRLHWVLQSSLNSKSQPRREVNTTKLVGWKESQIQNQELHFISSSWQTISLCILIITVKGWTNARYHAKATSIPIPENWRYKKCHLTMKTTTFTGFGWTTVFQIPESSTNWIWKSMVSNTYYCIWQQPTSSSGHDWIDNRDESITITIFLFHSCMHVHHIHRIPFSISLKRGFGINYLIEVMFNPSMFYSF